MCSKRLRSRLARSFAAALGVAFGVCSSVSSVLAEPGAPSAQALGFELELAVGEQRVIPTQDVQSYSEGVRGIVDVRLTRDASQFVVVALRSGTTSLLLLMKDGSERHYRISVTDPNAESVEAPAKPAAASVVQRDNIRLDFYFVQVDKSYHHHIGAAWPAALGNGFVSARYDLLTHRFDGATALVSSQPLPRLDMAQASGWAKLMRHAAVITANGEKATFSGGGEVNIPVQAGLGTGIHQITFGSMIQVAPRYDSESGRMDLYVHAEVSDLADDRGTGAPGRSTAMLDTVVNLELGQSLVLAGLTAKSETRNKAGLPGLSQIPVLGALFGTQAARTEALENLVVIVPTVVDAVALDDRERIKNALELYERYAGDIDEARLMSRP
jgi:pilus assembly protein CpaC